MDDEARASVLDALEEGGAPEETVRSVHELVVPSGEEEQRILGESLLAGLRLIEEEPWLLGGALPPVLKALGPTLDPD